MQLAIAEAKRARDRGDYAIGAVITRVTDGREVVIASAGNRVKTSTLRTNPARCVRVHACGRESVQSCTGCHRKTLQLMGESAGQNNTSGGRASFRANSSSRRAITRYQ